MRNLVTILILFSAATAATAGDNLIVPLEANELAKAHGCDQVADYFDTHPTAEDPPYALIAGDYGKLQIAVWCVKRRAKPQEQRSYTLLFRIDDTTHPLAKCPSELGGNQNIGGLRFIDVSDEVSRYYFVDTQKRIPGTGELRTKGVESIYDGVGERYVCIGGRWAFRAFD